MSLYTVKTDKLVHGGQAIAELPDGRKVFVWNALPGETVKIRLTKAKRSYAEGIAEEILSASPDRVSPIDEAYLSTSPWQIMNYEAENRHKQAILTETFLREKVAHQETIGMSAGDDPWHYRNKMEYSFWGDDEGIHLALFHRGSRGKRIVNGSSIARPEIDETANNICAILNKSDLRASQLKTVMVRCNQAGETVAALFVKDEDFPVLPELEEAVKGIAVYYSTPKSPASVITKELYAYGDIQLSDKVLSTEINYNVNSFFQVNLPVFELVLGRIDDLTKDIDKKVDFYSGVGTIGLPINASTLVDSDAHNIAMAKQNVDGRSTEVVHAPAESALDYIPKEGTLIVDPPRAGLHKKLISKIHEVQPDQLVYLSCNPITQARDVALLQDKYDLQVIEGYNFFPRTPHIESLAVLSLRK